MRTKQDGVGNQDGDDEGKSPGGRQLASNGEKADHCDQHGDGSAEDNHLPMQFDMTSDNRSKPEKGCEVEHVRAKNHPGTDRGLVMGKCGDGGRDLGGIGGHGGHHSQEPLGQAEPIPDPFEA